MRILLLLVLTAGTLALGAGSGNHTSFDPSAVHELSDDTAGVSSDIRTTFRLPKGDVQAERIIMFLPRDWGIAVDENLPGGAVVGDLTANVTVGRENGPCDSSLEAKFQLMDAATNLQDNVPYDDQFEVGEVGLPSGVERYPDYLTRIFHEPVNNNVLQPMVRLYGQTEDAGVPISFNLLVFEPGAVIKEPSGRIIGTDPRQGYPMVPVWQDEGDSNANREPSPITDWCTPVEAELTVFGTSRDNETTAADESGFDVRTNPRGGYYSFVTLAVSQRDADNDSYENALDACPFAENEGDPREPGSGDSDGDGLDDACDPDDLSADEDADGDGYLNREDNCPRKANGQDGDNQADVDFDDIGDACDRNPEPSGETLALCLVSPVVVPPGGPPPQPRPQDLQPCNPNTDPRFDRSTPTPGGIPPSGGEPPQGGAGVWRLIALSAAGLLTAASGLLLLRRR